MSGCSLAHRSRKAGARCFIMSPAAKGSPKPGAGRELRAWFVGFSGNCQHDDMTLVLGVRSARPEEPAAVLYSVGSGTRDPMRCAKSTSVGHDDVRLTTALRRWVLSAVS